VEEARPLPLRLLSLPVSRTPIFAAGNNVPPIPPLPFALVPPPLLGLELESPNDLIRSKFSPKLSELGRRVRFLKWGAVEVGDELERTRLIVFILP
jgi:hypothetical protein